MGTVRRVIGSHTYDIIANNINNIHKEFGIVGKVNCTSTDSGSKFLKAFNIFGIQTPTTTNENVDNLTELDGEDDSETEGEFVYISLGELFDDHTKECAEKESSSNDIDEENVVLDNDKEESVQLPKHFKCSFHLFNLIATTDINNISNVVLKKMKKRAEAKLEQASSEFPRVDFIKGKLDVLFILHNTTRWNSYFDAVKRVLIDIKRDALKEVFVEFKFLPLTSEEEEYLNEYVRIMERFTEALDVLQSEEMRIGCVLPTIKLLKD